MTTTEAQPAAGLTADVERVIDDLIAREEAARAALIEDIAAFVNDARAPDRHERHAGRYAYPELRVVYAPDGPSPQFSAAFGKLNKPGVYAAAIAQPRLFRAYLTEQLTLLAERYPEAKFEVRASDRDIPYPYALADAAEGLPEADPRVLADHFPTPQLSELDDGFVDGVDAAVRLDGATPLSLFDGPRVDFSLQRIRHYTGTPASAVQSHVLFTNYHRYVGEFVRWAVERARENEAGWGVVAPGGPLDLTHEDPAAVLESGPAPREQMPAYHLTAPHGQGVTLVNIGVGPSNAKTITDHLAVLRPQCWLMIGHCGGLRPSQRMGDYALAHAYLRRDKVLDERVGLDIPIPPIAEIQIALQQAAAEVTGASGRELKERLRTGTVVTYADRNWETAAAAEERLFNASRAIAVDMESATIAANGFRFRVPYGTLLCVSDKPLHGEIKLPGPANRFYQTAIAQHLQIGLRALELLMEQPTRLHSRKLRAFDEPPFR